MVGSRADVVSCTLCQFYKFVKVYLRAGYAAPRRRSFSPGGIKTTDTDREPHRGQRSLEDNIARGKSRPRVETSVSMSRSYVQVHRRTDFKPSRLP